MYESRLNEIHAHASETGEAGLRLLRTYVPRSESIHRVSVLEIVRSTSAGTDTDPATELPFPARIFP
jgi:hypothetical protein